MTGALARPRFVTLDEAMAFHAIAIAQFGGSMGVRDQGLLESALAQPRQGFSGQYSHEFPFEMAAAYAFHLAKNHPFVDGNKRVALACCIVFLRMNGWNLTSEGVEAADAVIGLVESRLDKRAFATWLREHSRERPSLELRDFFASVDPAQFLEAFRSTRPDAVGSRPPEFQASMDDVGRSMPILHALLDINRTAVRDADESMRLTSTSAILTLATLYRLAEDMGYEW